MSISSHETDRIEAATLYWLENVVIGLNLCPFAKKEFLEQRISLHVSALQTAGDLLELLRVEIKKRDTNNDIATTRLILPKAFQNFYDFNDFLDEAEQLITVLNKTGEYQLASFHPDYQFAGTQASAAENYTNRSPYPILHILREEHVSRAVDSHPNTEAIPERNIALMNELGVEKMKGMLAAAITQGESL